MTTEKIIVLVSDRGDSKHGEVSVLEDPEHAERLVETLLEAGFEPERIRVFSGRASEFQVSHRPVVALVAEGEESEPPTAGAITVVEEKAPAREEGERASEGVSEGEAAPEGEPAAADDAEMAAPVRFSSLFRSA